MRVTSALALALAILALSPALAERAELGGQEPAAGPQRLRESPPGIETLSPGNEVRLTTSEADRQDATYVGYRSESLVVRQEGESFEVPMRTVRSLHVRSHSMWEGAWKASIIGASVGAAWAIIQGATECPTPTTCRSEYWPVIPIDTVIGAAIGGGVGAVVGRLIPTWQRVFP